MRSALPFLAASAALVLATGAFAAGKSPSTDTGTSSSSSTSSDTSANASDKGATASSATGAGANTSATAGGFHVGQTVVDNTGATIGAITSLDTAGGQQMAVIKMGSQSFQAPTDRLGTSDGNATINMTKAQLSDMIKGASTGAAGGSSSGSTPGSAPRSGAHAPGGGT